MPMQLDEFMRRVAGDDYVFFGAERLGRPDGVGVDGLEVLEVMVSVATADGPPVVLVLVPEHKPREVEGAATATAGPRPWLLTREEEDAWQNARLGG